MMESCYLPGQCRNTEVDPSALSSLLESLLDLHHARTEIVELVSTKQPQGEQDLLFQNYDAGESAPTRSNWHCFHSLPTACSTP